MLKYLKAALILHIWLLWALIDSKDTPRHPSDNILKVFESRFKDKAAVNEAHSNGQPLVSPDIVEVCTSVSISDRSHIAGQLLAIEEHIIEYIKVQLAKFGFETWCPDLCQTPYFIYNAACQIIAINTFKQALIAHAYTHLALNLAYIKDMLLIVQMYNHFVHHYQWVRYRKECCTPGSVRATEEAGPVYKRRVGVSSFSL